MSVIGDKIKKARKAAKLSQIVLAKAVGIIQAALSEFETDKSEPRDSTNLIKDLVVRYDERFDRIDERFPRIEEKLNIFNR